MALVAAPEAVTPVVTGPVVVLVSVPVVAALAAFVAVTPATLLELAVVVTLVDVTPGPLLVAPDVSEVPESAGEHPEITQATAGAQNETAKRKVAERSDMRNPVHAHGTRMDHEIDEAG